MIHPQAQPDPSTLSGHDLIAAGARPGRWFAPALLLGNEALAKGASRVEALALALSQEPAILDLNPWGAAPMHVHLTPESAEERENLAAVRASMAELLRTPMTKAGALMPDACPTGGRGVIPVGGIALSEQPIVEPGNILAHGEQTVPGDVEDMGLIGCGACPGIIAELGRNIRVAQRLEKFDLRGRSRRNLL